MPRDVSERVSHSSKPWKLATSTQTNCVQVRSTIATSASISRRRALMLPTGSSVGRDADREDRPRLAAHVDLHRFAADRAVLEVALFRARGGVDVEGARLAARGTI